MKNATSDKQFPSCKLSDKVINGFELLLRYTYFLYEAPFGPVFKCI